MVNAEEEMLTLAQQNPLHLKAIDHIEFYVGNARQAAHFYRTAFGFKPVAFAGLETGVRDRVSFIVEQNNIRLVLTSAILPEGQVADHIKLHGDGVKDIALTVDDTEGAFGEAVRRGARPIMEPTIIEDDERRIVKATIGAYGDTVHSFIERRSDDDRLLPGYESIKHPLPTTNTGLATIDHVAISVEPGTLNYWIDFYNNVLGFRQSHQENVFTEYSAMNSKVVQNSTALIKFPIMEPAEGKRKSQIEEYLHSNCGPGAQHIAFLTGDIVNTVKALSANGIEFLRTPGAYYDHLEERIGKIDADMEELRELNILVDRDGWGHLLQVFTKPLQSRPTVFLEIIQRKGARGFGGGNIKALFQALEHEQALRGNL